MTRVLATVLAVVLAQQLLAGVTVDLGPAATLVAAGVLLLCAGLGLRSRQRAPYLGDGVALVLLVPLRGPLTDLVRSAAPASPAAVAVGLALSLGPLGFVLGRQLGRCLGGGLAAVLAGLAAGEALVMCGAVGWLPSWVLGAVVAAGLAALAEAGRSRTEEPVADTMAPTALLAGALLVLWVDVLARITSAYTTPSAWGLDDALTIMVVLTALVAWPASAWLRHRSMGARRVIACAGALLLAAALWSALSELAIYRDQIRAVDLARRLFDHATRLGLADSWWLWLATFAGLRAAAAGLVLGALEARSAGALACGAGLAVLGLAWGGPAVSGDPMLIPAAELLAAAGLAVTLVPVAAWGRRGLLALPVVALPFLLLPADERPRFDEIRRRGEFAVQATRREAQADVVLYSTPDIDSLAVEGRTAAATSCTCERAALSLDASGELVESIVLRHDPARPCLGLRIAGVPVHAGHGPVGDAGSVGRMLRVFAPRGRLLVSGLGAELLAADLHDAGLLQEGVVASSAPLGDEIGFTLLDSLGSRVWSAAEVHDPLSAALSTRAADLDGVVVPPEHAAWGSASWHAGREQLERLARRLLPGGRCLLFLDTSALDGAALDARLSAFGAVYGERSAAFVEPRELDAPFILALGWIDDAGAPERGELEARLAVLGPSPLRSRLRSIDDLGSLLLRDGPGMRAGAERGSPLCRTRPTAPRRGAETGWAAVAAVADEGARLAAVVRGAGERHGIEAEVLAGLRVHASYRYRLRDLNDTTFFLPDDVDWDAFDEEVAQYVAAAARAPEDALLHLVLAALLEPLAVVGDYGRFARVYEACGAREMECARLALLEAWVQRSTLEEDAARRALERARRLLSGEG